MLLFDMFDMLLMFDILYVMHVIERYVMHVIECYCLCPGPVHAGSHLAPLLVRVHVWLGVCGGRARVPHADGGP